MKSQKPKSHKQNRVVKVLLLPFMVILWSIGWSLYWVGHRKTTTKSIKNNQRDYVTFTVLMPEKKHAK